MSFEPLYAGEMQLKCGTDHPKGITYVAGVIGKEKLIYMVF